MMMGLRRPGVVIITAVVLWLPTVRQLLAGSITLDTACIRLLAALALAWVGIAVLCRVTTGYRSQGPRRELIEAPNRRWDDSLPSDEQS